MSRYSNEKNAQLCGLIKSSCIWSIHENIGAPLVIKANGALIMGADFSVSSASYPAWQETQQNGVSFLLDSFSMLIDICDKCMH